MSSLDHSCYHYHLIAQHNPDRKTEFYIPEYNVGIFPLRELVRKYAGACCCIERHSQDPCKHLEWRTLQQ